MKKIQLHLHTLYNACLAWLTKILKIDESPKCDCGAPAAIPKFDKLYITYYLCPECFVASMEKNQKGNVTVLNREEKQIAHT